jgi:hypothetical protein
LECEYECDEFEREVDVADDDGGVEEDLHLEDALDK